MAHNLERLRHAAVDALVRTANASPNKRLGTIFLVLNFTHVAQVSQQAWTAPAGQAQRSRHFLDLPSAHSGASAGAHPQRIGRQLHSQTRIQGGRVTCTGSVNRVNALLTCLPHVQAIREASAKAAQNPLPGEAEVTAQEAPGGPLGQEGVDTQREFDEQAAAAVSRYVDDALQRNFGSLVSARRTVLHHKLHAPASAGLSRVGGRAYVLRLPRAGRSRCQPLCGRRYY